MLIIFHINHQNTNIQPNRRHTGEYYPQRLILHKSTSHNPDRMKKKPASARGRPKRLPTYRLRKDGTCGTSSDSHAGSLPKRPSDGPATLDLGGGIERHVCFAAAYDRHHPLPIQATPLPEKIPVHATKRNFRASIIENNRNRHDLWAKRLSSPCLQGCSCCTHPRRRRRTRKVPRRKLHDRDGRIRRRRQIPGKRISSVLLYGRLHLRQALVSRSRLLVRHLLSGREDDRRITLPLFVRTRYAFLTSRITPYFQLDLGIPIFLGGATVCHFPDYTGRPITYEQPTWFYCCPEAGVSFRLRKRRALHLGLGVMINYGEFYRDYGINGRPVHESSELTASLSFTAGFTF